MDLVMTRGDTKIFQVPVTDANGEARDLTGASVIFTCKVSPFDALPVFEVAVTSFSDPESGIAEIVVGPESTEDISEFVVYVYDIQLTEASSQVTTLQSGKLTINLDVG